MLESLQKHFVHSVGFINPFRLQSSEARNASMIFPFRISNWVLLTTLKCIVTLIILSFGGSLATHIRFYPSRQLNPRDRQIAQPPTYPDVDSYYEAIDLVDLPDEEALLNAVDRFAQRADNELGVQLP